MPTDVWQTTPQFAVAVAGHSEESEPHTHPRFPPSSRVCRHDTSAKLNTNIDTAARALVENILSHEDIFQKQSDQQVRACRPIPSKKCMPPGCLDKHRSYPSPFRVHSRTSHSLARRSRRRRRKEVAAFEIRSGYCSWYPGVRPSPPAGKRRRHLVTQ